MRLSISTMDENLDTEETGKEGYYESILFEPKCTPVSSVTSSAEESEDSSNPTIELITDVVPFALLWSFGVNVFVPFINLTDHKRSKIFFAAAHDGVLYDYVTNEMKHFQGHQNAIRSMSVEKTGKYLVTADAGNENTIIVWDTYKCKPVRTIFNLNPKSGSAFVAISNNGKYIINITEENEPMVKFWLWTHGQDEANDSYLPRNTFGKPVAVKFNPNVQEHVMIAFRKQIVFLTWDLENNCFADETIPAVRKKGQVGLITDCTYMEDCHECVASTSEGCILIFGNTLHVQPFVCNEEMDNKKMFIKTIKISRSYITCITNIDGLIVTGDERGHIKFYDKMVRIMYWCQNFELPSIVNISFNLEPRKYKFEDPYTLDNKYFIIPSPRKIINGEIKDYDDVSEEVEILYKSLVPSDATVHKPPFIVRDFILATDDGNLVKVNYINNTKERLFNMNDSEVAAIDVHQEEPYLVIAYKKGRICMYNYLTHVMIVTNVLPEAITELKSGPQESEFQLLEESSFEEEEPEYVSVTCMKYSPQCYFLAVGRGNGEVWFIDPIMLEPQHKEPIYPTKNGVVKVAFSIDSKYFAYFDNNRTVCLYRYESDTKTWVLQGKVRSHYKSIVDILFTDTLPAELYTIGMDRYLVKYDILNCIEGGIEMESRERIDQSAIANCFMWYPLINDNNRYLLLADNQFKLKIMNVDTRVYRHIFLGAAYGCYSETTIKQICILPNTNNDYLVFANERHIGIQILPPDGNPYKYTGTIGHPLKLSDFCVTTDGQYAFTTGDKDYCVLMWKINTEAVDNLCRSGGRELFPFYCLIEGGQHGWLFTEMQNLFYYMQILHQGENSMLPRNVTDRISTDELPDLMRACGYYPSEYEIGNMLNDVTNQSLDAKEPVQNEITFVDFIRLYINHRPAHGISLNTLKDAFQGFSELAEYGGDGTVSRDEFTSVLCEEGEKLTPEAAHKCLCILMRCQQDEVSANVIHVGQNHGYSFLPDEINFDTLVGDVLGIDMNRSNV